MPPIKKQPGYLVLVMAIIVTAIGALLAVNNLAISENVLRLTNDSQISTIVSHTGSSCGEVALSKFRVNRNYPGNEQILLDAGKDAVEGTDDDLICQILTVASTQEEKRVFHTIAKDELYTKYREISIRATSPELQVEYDRSIASLEGTHNELHPFVTGIYTNLLMWMSARAFENNPNRATSVNEISDLSPNARTITQSNQDFRPQYLENGLSGMPTIKFDGVDDWLATDLNLPESNYSIAVVYSSNDVSGNFVTSVGTLSSNSSSHDRQFGLQSGLLGQRVWNLESIFSASSYNSGNPHIAMSTLGSAGQFVYVDGVQVASGIKSQSDFNTDVGMIIGGHTTWGFLDGQIAEILIFNTQLTASQRSQLFEYLGKIYNITIN
jgi:hypothetical protein